LAYSPSGRYLVFAQGHVHVAQVLDLQSEKIVRVYRGHTSAVRTVAYSKTGRYVVTGDDDGKLMAWEAPPDP
jgi:WD40 repeat protein